VRCLVQYGAALTVGSLHAVDVARHFSRAEIVDYLETYLVRNPIHPQAVIHTSMITRTHNTTQHNTTQHNTQATSGVKPGQSQALVTIPGAADGPATAPGHKRVLTIGICGATSSGKSTLVHSPSPPLQPNSARALIRPDLTRPAIHSQSRGHR
jgi:pantothenate kinase